MAPAPPTLPVRVDAHLAVVPPRPVAVLATLLDKVAWTYVQTVVTLLAAQDALNIGAAQAMAIAAIPAALTVLANGLPVIPAGLPFGLDLVLRVARTYAVSVIGFLVAVPAFSLEWGILVAAATAAGPAALAAAKAALASRVGALGSGALLPADLDATQTTVTPRAA